MRLALTLAARASTDAEARGDLRMTAVTQRLEVRLVVREWPVEPELVDVVNVGRGARATRTRRMRCEKAPAYTHPALVHRVAAHAGAGYSWRRRS